MKQADIQRVMTALKVSEEEAIEILKSDEEIDRMPMTKVNDDLSDEAKAVAKKARQSDRKIGVKRTNTKEKDAEKVEIIAKIADFLGENAEIVNAGQEITLKIGENDYSIKLTKHRKAKNS